MNPDLSWVLNDLLQVPGARHAILVSADGLLLANSSEIGRDDAETVAAAMSSMQSLSRAVTPFIGTRNPGRWKQTLHVTIPGLIPTVVLLSTLAMGNVLNAGFDQVFNMYNQLVISSADIIDTYVYRIGITNMQFSLGTAAGLFKSVVSLILVVVSYTLAYKFADYSIF